jgi:cytoskeletal protein CcmA (bactofilin family)
MLDATKKRSFGDTKVVTIIGQGTTVIGELKSKGTIRIEGVVSGRVHSDDTIVVQESGRVKADLYAGQITISGEVEGNIFAQDRLEIATNGKLVGDIVSPRVSIAEGVLFEGKCTMKPPGQAPSSQGAAPAQHVQARNDGGAHGQGGSAPKAD